MTAVIKQSDIKRAAKIAKEAGVTVEIERDGITIRIKPDDGLAAQAQQPQSALEAWRAGRARGG